MATTVVKKNSNLLLYQGLRSKQPKSSTGWSECGWSLGVFTASSAMPPKPAPSAPGSMPDRKELEYSTVFYLHAPVKLKQVKDQRQ